MSSERLEGFAKFQGYPYTRDKSRKHGWGGARVG